VKNKIAGVASGSTENEERAFILECIQVYKSLPALWDVKSKEYSNGQEKKKDTYAMLLDKYRDRYTQANREDVTKKCNPLGTNLRKEMKRLDNSEKSGAGSEGVFFSFFAFTSKAKAMAIQATSSQNCS
jgi:hypothetical protein